MQRKRTPLTTRVAGLLLLATALLTSGAEPLPAAPAGPVVRIDVEGTINPAINDYIGMALERARVTGAQAVLIRMNTPGGLLESTREIVQELLGADIPVIVWVGPPGSRAASAGMFITLAAHVAVMAPGTNIGAATPISSGGKDVQQEGGQDLARKVLEDTRAFARSIAEVRKRPVEFMEAAVTKAVSITSEEALAQNVIDAVASSEAELLANLDGRTVDLGGRSVTLTTAAAPIDTFAMRPGQQLMHHLSHPNIAYLLMLLGMLGIYFELSAPGGYIAGVLGVISLLLAFTSFQVLPFRTGGLMLILLSVGMFVAEVFVPSMGILTLGGIVSFVVGSLILFNTPELDVALDPALIAGATAAFALCAVAIGSLILRAQKRGPSTGVETFVGSRCEAHTDLDPAGKVFLQGEIWQATLEQGQASKGELLEVTAVDGLNLTVRRPNPSS